MKRDNKIIPSSKAVTDKDYKGLLQELKSIIAKGQFKAYKAVDNIKVQTYWQLGERIVREELKHEDRAYYGKYLIDSLAVDLKIPKRRLYEIVRFYRVYPIVRSVTAQLSWTHYTSLIEIENEEKRAFYENKAILNSWSVRDLKKEIKAKLYENTPKKEIQTLFQVKLPSSRPQEIFKDTYNFRFIELEKGRGESDLENKILESFAGINLLTEEVGFKPTGLSANFKAAALNQYSLNLAPTNYDICNFTKVKMISEKA